MYNRVQNTNITIKHRVFKYIKHHPSNIKHLTEFIPNFEHEEKGKNLDQKM